MSVSIWLSMTSRMWPTCSASAFAAERVGAPTSCMSPIRVEITTRRPNLPVMIVTAYGDDERRQLAGEYAAPSSSRSRSISISGRPNFAICSPPRTG